MIIGILKNSSHVQKGVLSILSWMNIKKVDNEKLQNLKKLVLRVNVAK